MKAILLRHGQIPGNVEYRYVSTTNQHLTEKGRQQAREANPPAATKVYSSPYIRCLETAQIVFPDTPAVVVDDLREMDFGIFEGKRADDMKDFKPYRDWVDSRCMDPIPDGESMAELNERCSEAFKRIVGAADDDDTIALVVHGGTIMSIMGEFNDEGREYFEYHVNNCGYYVCECILSPELRLHRIGGDNPGGTLPPD